MAVVSDIEAVLEFLKVNGLSESESALMTDLLEKTETTSSDFDNFLFPMVPPLRPLRISENRRLPEAEIETRGVGGGVDSSGDSSEEFVSLGSSTDDVCSSEFTDPYGIHNTTKLSSQASSDRLSQFGTARDYHDFDMQNDLHWYNGVDDDYIVPPCFGRSDSLICPSEDKFVTTLETYKQIDSQLDLENVPEGFQTVERSKYSEKHWPSSHFHSMDDVNGADGGVVDNEKKWSTVCSCSAPDCVGCADQEGFLSGDTLDPTVMYLKVADVNNLTCEKTPTYDWDEEFKGAADFQIAVAKKDRNGDYKGASDGEKPGDPHVLDCTAYEDEDRADQLSMYDSIEDEYETFSLRIIHRKNRTGFEENKDLPIVLSSVIAGRYYVTEYLGSAAFSKVVQAHDMHTGMDVCLKIIKNNKDFFDQSLDEVKLLKFVNKHDPRDERHILRLYDYFYYQEHLFIVSELLRANLYEFHKYNQESGGEPYFTLSRLQLITQQCLEALEYLHHLGVIHCDLKPENILVKSYQRCEIKVIDLGSSCFSTDNLCLYVQSRSYRAPEVILGLPYDQKIDLWSLGCILAELCSGEVLFPNDAVVMLLSRMIGMLGPIDVEMLAKGQEIHKYFTKDFDLYHISEETNQLECIIPEESSLEHHLQVSDTGFIDFVRSLLEINPQRRPTASIALQHPWLSYQHELNSH